MSGVIDENGQQWEHCCQCSDFVKLEELHYAYSPNWPQYERVDLCEDCFTRNYKHYIHRFTVLSNWRNKLWTDAMADDSSLQQYNNLTAAFIDAGKKQMEA